LFLLLALDEVDALEELEELEEAEEGEEADGRGGGIGMDRRDAIGSVPKRVTNRSRNSVRTCPPIIRIKSE